MLKEIPDAIYVTIDKSSIDIPIAKAVCLYMDFEKQMKESLNCGEYQVLMKFIEGCANQQIDKD